MKSDEIFFFNLYLSLKYSKIPKIKVDQPITSIFLSLSMKLVCTSKKPKNITGVEAIKIFTVTNLINCLKHFEKIGYLILGTSEHAVAMHTELDLNKPVLAIMGSEEEGIREKTLEKCSEICTLSKNKTINSLNVSVATGVILFEITRQKLV